MSVWCKNHIDEQNTSVLRGQGLNVMPGGKYFFDIEILHMRFVLYPHEVNNKSGR